MVCDRQLFLFIVLILSASLFVQKLTELALVAPPAINATSRLLDRFIRLRELGSSSQRPLPHLRPALPPQRNNLRLFMEQAPGQAVLQRFERGFDDVR